MNYTSESPVTPLDNKIAAGVLLLITIFGCFCNGFVILLVRDAPSMHNSFGVLAFSQAIADFGQQAIFAFYVVPIMTLDSPLLKSPQVMSRIGHAVVICYQVCGYSHVCTSFNRFSSVYLPTWFKKTFNRRNTVILTIGIWALAVVPTSVFLLHPYFDCYMLFDIQAWAWNYAATEKCMNIAFNVHFPTYISLATTFTVLDILTLWRVYRYTKVGVATQTAPEMGGKARKRKLETIFFWQVCLQGVLFVTELITYFYLATLTTDKWMRFFLTDVIWCICHAGDGFLIISLNRELREGIKYALRCDLHLHLVPEPSYYFGADSNSPSVHRDLSVSSDLPRQLNDSLLPPPSSDQNPSLVGLVSSDQSSSQPLVIMVQSDRSRSHSSVEQSAAQQVVVASNSQPEPSQQPSQQAQPNPPVEPIPNEQVISNAQNQRMPAEFPNLRP